MPTVLFNCLLIKILTILFTWYRGIFSGFFLVTFGNWTNIYFFENFRKIIDFPNFVQITSKKLEVSHENRLLSFFCRTNSDQAWPSAISRFEWISKWRWIRKSNFYWCQRFQWRNDLTKKEVIISEVFGLRILISLEHRPTSKLSESTWNNCFYLIS